MTVINVLYLCGNKKPGGTKLSDCGILTVMAASTPKLNPLRPAGFLLLTMGWILVLSAVVLLKQETARGGFVVAGMAVEALGLVLTVRSHVAPKPERN
jgi:hypothetical protein